MLPIRAILRGLRRLRVARATCALGIASTVAACGGRDPAATTLFAGPGQVAVAGAAKDRVFVANRGTDSVQVLQLTEQLSDSDFVASQARYFPLNLSVGAEPTELAAAGHGAFVFVLDSIDGTVSVIDAIALRVLKDDTGARLRVPIGDVASQPRGIVGHTPATCTASVQPDKGACVARAYVSLKALGSIAVVDLRIDAAGTASLVVDNQYRVGGAPQGLAMGGGDALFVTDDASPNVVRVSLPNASNLTPSIDRIAIGVPAASIAVTDTAVAVTRPAYGDVLVLTRSDDATASVDTGTLAARDGDPSFAPLPRCLQDCNATTDTCPSAHPADRALCVSADGYGQPAEAAPYGGLPTRGVPQALAALPASYLAQPFVAHCLGGTDTMDFASGFAVASLGGAVELIGLLADGTPRLVDAAFCRPPTLHAVDGSPGDLATVLASCPAHPARNRFACAAVDGADTDNTAAALVLRGQDGERVGLAWEGVLPGGDGSAGGAVLSADGTTLRRASRDGLDFAQAWNVRAANGSAQRGDIVEVITGPVDSEACQAAGLDVTTPCARERRIAAFIDADPRSGQPTGIVLDAPLPAACFVGDIAYRLRVGDGFLAGRLDASNRLDLTTLARLSPGERYGPPAPQAVSLPLSFALRDDLDTGSTLSPCERYAADGRARVRAPAWRSRLGISAVRVDDPARPLQLAAAYDPAGRIVRQWGFMPHALTFVPHDSVGGLRLVVSFAGSNAVYVTAATSSRDLLGDAAPGRGRLYTN